MVIISDSCGSVISAQASNRKIVGLAPSSELSDFCPSLHESASELVIGKS